MPDPTLVFRVGNLVAMGCWLGLLASLAAPGVRGRL